MSRQEALNKAAGIASANLELDKLPIKDFSPAAKAALTEAQKIKNANIVTLLDDRWALSYVSGKAVSELKAAVAPQIVLNYVGISSVKPNETSKAAQAGVGTALPTQPQEIVSCIKGETIERYWIAHGKPGDSLRCTVATEVDGKVAAAWYAKKDGSFCQPKLIEMAKVALDKGYNCSGR